MVVHLTEDKDRFQANFSIVLPEENNFTALQLLNYLGQVVVSRTIDVNDRKIEIERNSDWKPGTYFLKVNGQEQSITKKVILY